MYRFIEAETTVFVAGGGEGFAFKCMSVGFRKGFIGYKTAMTSFLSFTTLVALSLLGLFFPP